MKLLEIILGLIALFSFIWAYASEEQRIIAIVVGFTVILLLVISEIDEEVRAIKSRQRKLEEKLKIHEQLIEIKKDIAMLKERKR